MSRRVCVIDLPGLSAGLLSAVPPTSSLGKWIANQRVVAMTPSWPAVTCSVQATLTTGVSPSHHGIVANGIPTFRSTDDQRLVDTSNFESYRKRISFWEQSNQFLAAPRFWQDENGRSKFKTAMLFFQHSMPGFVDPRKPAADVVLTPKPDHGPDGKIVSLCWSSPNELVGQLFATLGPFPLMNYWGPMAGIVASRWIARSAAIVWQMHRPQLQWVYVPHLDYDLQRFGPGSTAATKAVADVSAALDPLIDDVLRGGDASIVLLSEYALSDVNRSVQPNRLLASAGLLQTRDSADGKLIDYDNSQALAMADHQIAHVYTKDARATALVRELFASEPVNVCGPTDLAAMKLNHRRSGDLLMVANDNTWLDYRWWSDPADAPSFARTVDIHRKPGYDPLELFWDRAANGIVQDANLVRGSHGAVKTGEAVLVGDPAVVQSDCHATDVARVVMDLMK